MSIVFPFIPIIGKAHTAAKVFLAAEGRGNSAKKPLNRGDYVLLYGLCYATALIFVALCIAAGNHGDLGQLFVFSNPLMWGLVGFVAAAFMLIVAAPSREAKQ